MSLLGIASIMSGKDKIDVGGSCEKDNQEEP